MSKKEKKVNNIAVIYGGIIIQKHCIMFATGENLDAELQKYEEWYDNVTFVACKSEKSVDELQNLLNVSTANLTKRGKQIFEISISDAKDLAKQITSVNTCNTISERATKKTDVVDTTKSDIVKPESKAIVLAVDAQVVATPVVAVQPVVPKPRGRKPKETIATIATQAIAKETIATQAVAKETIATQAVTQIKIEDDDIPGLSTSKNPNVEIVATPAEKPAGRGRKKNQQLVVPP